MIPPRIVCALSLIACSVSEFLSFGHAKPLPWSEKGTPREVSATLGVGFDLTADYGTASIRFQNGTTRDVVKIDGDAEYRTLMRRLVDEATEESVNRKTSSKLVMDARLREKIASRWRGREEETDELLSGQPANQQLLGTQPRASNSVTTDVHILTALIAALRDAVELDLGAPVSSIVVSIPSTTSFSPELLESAIAAAGLEDLNPRSSSLTSASASLINLELLISLLIQRGTPCKILILEYYPLALISSTTAISTSLSSASPLKSTLDHAAGSIASHSHTFPSEKAYWNYIQLATSRQPNQHLGEPIDLVVPLGEYADDEDFVKNLKEVNMEWSGLAGKPVTMPRESRWHPLYAAARGAAEIARRSIETPAAKPNERGDYEREGAFERVGDEAIIPLELR